jgi:hypothetical protein
VGARSQLADRPRRIVDAHVRDAMSTQEHGGLRPRLLAADNRGAVRPHGVGDERVTVDGGSFAGDEERAWAGKARVGDDSVDPDVAVRRVDAVEQVR